MEIDLPIAINETHHINLIYLQTNLLEANQTYRKALFTVEHIFFDKAFQDLIISNRTKSENVLFDMNGLNVIHQSFEIWPLMRIVLGFKSDIY